MDNQFRIIVTPDKGLKVIDSEGWIANAPHPDMQGHPHGTVLPMVYESVAEAQAIANEIHLSVIRSDVLSASQFRNFPYSFNMRKW
jgi:hypothetical protein